MYYQTNDVVVDAVFAFATFTAEASETLWKWLIFLEAMFVGFYDVVVGKYEKEAI